MGEKGSGQSEATAPPAVPVSSPQPRHRENVGDLEERMLWRLLSPSDKLAVPVAVVAAVGSGTVRPLMALVFGQLVDSFNGRNGSDAAATKAEINKYVLYYVYLFAGQFILVWLYSTLLSLSATNVVRSLRLAHMRALISQDVAYLESYSPGAVASDMLNEASIMQTGFSETLGVAIASLSVVLTSFIVAFTQSWKLTLVTGTSIVALFVFLHFTDRMQARLGGKISNIYTEAAGILEEALSSITVITALGAGKKFQRRYNTCLEAAKAATINKSPTSGAELGLAYFCFLAAFGLVFWYGIQLLLNGNLPNGGRIVIVIMCINQATNALMNLIPSWAQITKARVALDHFRAIIIRKSEKDPFSAEGMKPESFKGRVEFHNVTFKYPSRPDVPILYGFNLTIEAGKSTAIIGPSGSGKSTITSLIERWYSCSSGKLLFDGMDAEALNLHWLRRQIGFVQQEPFLFNDTVFQNVANGLHGTSLEYDPEQVEKLVHRACVDANIHDFILQLPQGYLTTIGERGSRLSGGQKQRIAIARAIVAQPLILLLDEATAALDPEGERQVQIALDNASKSRTTVTIAHKLSTIRNANKIILLHNGCIVEEGNHQELLAQNGAYARLLQAENLNRKVFDEERMDVAPLKTEQSLFNTNPNLEKEIPEPDFLENLKPAVKNVVQRIPISGSFQVILSESRNLRGLLVLGVIACILTGGIYPGIAVVFAKSISALQYSGEKLMTYGSFWALIWFILGLIMCIGTIAMGTIFCILGILITKRYRAEYFASLINQDISFFDLDSNSSGALAGRLIEETNQLESFVSTTLGFIPRILVNLVSCWALSLAVSWNLALVAIFGSLPIIFASGWLRVKVIKKIQHRNGAQYSETARFASEAVGASKTVSSLCMEQEICDGLARTLAVPIADFRRTLVPNMGLFALTQSSKLLGSALIFWYGGGLLASGEINAYQLLLVYNAISAGGDAAATLFTRTNSIVKAHAASKNILQLREQQPAINSSQGVVQDAADTIEFRNVSFSYATRAETPSLRKLNLEVQRGQNIALVGPSGSGKSTVISLLLRFYDVASGIVLINGRPLTSLAVDAYRSHISVVTQETMLFRGTIRDNILLGIEDVASVSEERLEQVCRDANIHDFILSLPAGYNTQCGGKGLHLSGGQRQRLAIARALIRNPSLLLLDEATSALDGEGEKVVLDAMKTAMKGRSTVTVAHRLSTVRHADRIYVLADGEVKESGNHEELLRVKGAYWAMCRAQSLTVDALQ